MLTHLLYNKHAKAGENIHVKKNISHDNNTLYTKEDLQTLSFPAFSSTQKSILPVTAQSPKQKCPAVVAVRKIIPVRQNPVCGANSLRGGAEEQRAWKSGTCATPAAVLWECGAYFPAYQEPCPRIGILPDAER